MKNVVAYCRVSTNKEDQLNSFEAQKEFFTEYAKQNGLNLVHIYADEGITGTSRTKRTEFNRMMTDSEKGIFELVLVKDVSRFARNTVDLLEGVRKLKALNIDTRFITANMTSLGESEFILTIFGAMAQEESANMSKRVKFGKRMNAQKGKVPNICYGYIKIKGDYFNLKINEAEADIVREIFDLYTNKGYGVHKIAKLLNSRGLKSVRGVDWTVTSVSRIIKNKIYAGYVINGRTEVKDFISKERIKHTESEWYEVENPSMRIIPLELWERAQRVNEQNNNNNTAVSLHRKRSNTNLYSTLIVCPVCGYSFRRFTAKRKNHTKIWWGCSGRNHHGTDFCPNMTTIPEDELTETLDNFFSSLISDRETFIACIVSQLQKNKPESQNSVLMAQLSQLERKRQKQMQMFEADIITIEELKAITSELDRQIGQLKLDIDYTETPEDIEKKSKELYKMFADNFEKFSSVANMTNAELKRLVRTVTAGEHGDIQIDLNI